MSWFSKPHTWDELKKQKEHFEEENHILRYKIKSLEADLSVAEKNVQHKIKMATEELEVTHRQEILNLQIEQQKEYQEKMTNYFIEVETKGNSQTKFVQDMALKMLDKSPNITKIGG